LPVSPAAEGIGARLVEFGEQLRAEGVNSGTAELLDAFAVLEQIPWTEPDDFREALAATLAKSQEDRRIFELVFERFFFRAAEAAAIREGVRESASGESVDAEHAEVDLDELRRQIAAALQEGSESLMRDLARLAIASFGRRHEGSGVIGVDVQRIRRALGLRTEAQHELPDDDPRRDGVPREALRRFEALLRRELERAQIQRTEQLPPSRPLNELDRALPSGPLQDLAAVHRIVAQLKRRLKTQGQETRGHQHHAHVDVRRTMRASLQTGGVPVDLRYKPVRPRRPEIYVLCDVSTSVTSASVFFLSVLHALHDSFRKMRSFVFIERISEVTDVFDRNRDFGAVSEAIARDAGVADVSGYTARDRHRARRRADERPRPARRRVRPHRRPCRANVLAEPRAAPVLELRRLRHLPLRAPLPGVRVLDDEPARGLRQGADASGPHGLTHARRRRG
jgi:uncharacterized protein with von Willebrand factor type A (vWA) domain